MKIAIVGAGGAVGREMLSLLAANPISEGGDTVSVFGSVRSRGNALAFGSKTLRSGVLWEDSFEGIEIALFAAGSDIALEWAPKLVDAGAIVIDNSSAFRMADDVPLVVPEINADRIPAGAGIVANPNCSTIILLMALHPLCELGGFEATVSTYQAVSGAGKAGPDALERERAGGPFRVGEPFPFPIDGNLFPLIGAIDPDTGSSLEETKMIRESQKILEWPELRLDVTCVRVGVERCHSESVTLRFESPVDLAEARELLGRAPGIVVHDDPLEPPVPSALAGTHRVRVGRLRQPHPDTLQMWLVGDQLLKGAALNAVDIARVWAE